MESDRGFSYLHVDLQRSAEQLLSREHYDYYSGGCEGEISLRESALAWKRFHVVPQLFVPCEEISQSTQFLSRERPSPLIIAPMATQRILHDVGEMGAARAARLTGVGYVLSTRCSSSPSQVAEAFSDDDGVEKLRQELPTWHAEKLERLGGADNVPALLMQIYLMNDPALTDALVNEATDAGFEGLVLTLDTPRVGIRIRDVRSNFVPGAGMLSEVIGAARFSSYSPEAWKKAYAQKGVVLAEDILNLANQCELPVIAKGVLSYPGATQAMAHGATGVWISNHGGRQFDASPSTAEALARFPRELGDLGDVVVDGGISCARDVIVARVLGARVVALGRAAAWALAVGGELGLACYLIELRTELDNALAVCGVPSFGDLNRDFLFEESSSGAF